MGDHFVFLVDRLLTESTLEAAIESRNQNQLASWTTTNDPTAECSSKDSDTVLTPRKIVECRICQDEDMDSNMETPCSCCGSLKYAHRRCVQRWCNEKGDTICEICQQLVPRIWLRLINHRISPTANDTKFSRRRTCMVFCLMKGWRLNLGELMYYEMFRTRFEGKSRLCFPTVLTAFLLRHGVPVDSDHDDILPMPFRPGYTAPPSIFRLGGIPMNLRGNWRIVRRNLNNQRLIGVVSTDDNLRNSDYDEDAVSTSRTMMCRAVAIMKKQVITHFESGRISLYSAIGDTSNLSHYSHHNQSSRRLLVPFSYVATAKNYRHFSACLYYNESNDLLPPPATPTDYFTHFFIS